MNLRINIDGVDRDMTEAEQTEYLAWQAEKLKMISNKSKADAERETLKQATLEKLGLTADEAAALFA
jgi:hypothetical protein